MAKLLCVSTVIVGHKSIAVVESHSSSAILHGAKENKRRLQTLSIDNAWSNKNLLAYLTFRMLQHTSSEVNGYNCYKHLKIQK